MLKTNFEVHSYTGKYWWNKTNVELFYLIFKFYFLESPREILFGVISGYYLYHSLDFRKFKKVCNMPKTILVLGFCPWKAKITWCPIKICLNLLHFESGRGLKRSSLIWDIKMNTGHGCNLTVAEFACYRKAEQEPAIWC